MIYRMSATAILGVHNVPLFVVLLLVLVPAGGALAGALVYWLRGGNQ